MHPAILDKHDQLVAARKRLGVARLDVFGSAARGDDFDPCRSDVDVLVVFAPGAAWTLGNDLRETFQNILDRPVDLIDRKTIETSRNHIRRRHILSPTEPVYSA